MNYELAKKLKGAGFPLQEYFGDGKGDFVIDKKHYESPTLEELIEACGEIFCGVHKLQLGGWIAFIFDIEDSTRQVEAKGSTPSEAVANLWLKLNEK